MCYNMLSSFKFGESTFSLEFRFPSPSSAPPYTVFCNSMLFFLVFSFKMARNQETLLFVLSLQQGPHVQKMHKQTCGIYYGVCIQYVVS